MAELTQDDIREIEQVHSSWIEYEVAGDYHSLMTLCADEIELWPPAAKPLIGRAAFSAQTAHGTTSIHRIEISGRRIRQDYVFIERRFHSQASPRKPSVDTAKEGRYMACSSSELVIVGPAQLTPAKNGVPVITSSQKLRGDFPFEKIAPAFRFFEDPVRPPDHN
jgi:hypothetical protein